MIVNNNINEQQTVFNARNKVIRRADDLARKINNTYPRISETNISDFRHIDSFLFLDMKLEDKIDDIRDLIRELYNQSTDSLSKIKAFTDVISKYKMGNCGESAELALIAAKVNNIEGGHYASFISKDSNSEKITDLDHAVLYVPNGENPYVIDPWLGFADFVPNAIQRYKNEFGYHFEFSDIPGEVFEFERTYAGTFENALDSIPLHELQYNYKELILPEPVKKEPKNNYKNQQ